MLDLQGELGAAQRVALAVDTSDLERARDLTSVAKNAGASLVKYGLEVSSARGSSWEYASRMAADADLDWVADTKGDDIPNTIGGLVENIVSLDHPPVAITMHTSSGIAAMEGAQEIAAEKGITMLGVTELTSIKEEELRRQYGFVIARLGMGELPDEILESDEDPVRKAAVHMRATEAHRAGLPGLVASPKELVDPIKSDPELANKFTMIPGTRSEGEKTHDQVNDTIPEDAIVSGADLLVIGRQVTDKSRPDKAFSKVVEEIQRGMDRRGA